MSGIITEPIFLETFPQMEPQNKSGAIQALVVAIYEIGCLLGSLSIVKLGDILGRRKSVLIGTVIMLVGTAIQASSYGMAQMIVGRIVTGELASSYSPMGFADDTTRCGEWDEYFFDSGLAS